MALTGKQRKAVEYLVANPDATPEQVVEAAGVSTFGSNGPEFLWRLLMNGALRLDVTPDGVSAVLEGQ